MTCKSHRTGTAHAITSQPIAYRRDGRSGIDALLALCQPSACQRMGLRPDPDFRPVLLSPAPRPQRGLPNKAPRAQKPQRRHRGGIGSLRWISGRWEDPEPTEHRLGTQRQSLGRVHPRSISSLHPCRALSRDTLCHICIHARDQRRIEPLINNFALLSLSGHLVRRAIGTDRQPPSTGCGVQTAASPRRHQTNKQNPWPDHDPSLRLLCPAMSIQPLPDHVVAQIKSSATITSLNSVACGLARNSLDAGATKITISLDYARGNCTVEDNGSGIAPLEFTPDGGLGKPHCTLFSHTPPAVPPAQH
jgi:hypothetical protein